MSDLIPKRNDIKVKDIERILGTYVRNITTVESKPRVKIHMELKQNLPFPKIMTLNSNYKIINLNVEDDMLIIGLNPKPKKSKLHFGAA